MKISMRDRRLPSQIQEAKGRHEDLGEILYFYEKLFHVQFIFKSDLRTGSWGRFLEEKEFHPGHLADGTPQISFEDLRMQEAPFHTLYQTVDGTLGPVLG